MGKKAKKRRQLRTPQERTAGAYLEAERRTRKAHDNATTRLDLSGISALATIPPLYNLHAIREVNLAGTAIDNLAPFSNLHWLEGINLQNTPIHDLSPLRGVTSLRRLNVAGTHVRRLAPLANLPNLDELILAGTRLEDFSQLSVMTSLHGLSLLRTNIKDLSPLFTLKNLELLSIADTQVDDLSPIAELTKLKLLFLDDTKVTSLMPLVNLTDLVSGANFSTRPRGGLSFAGCPLSDLTLRALAEEKEPTRTLAALNHIRAQQGLPPLKEDGEILAPTISQPPEIPAAGPGPHFVLNDRGVLDFAPPEALDQEGNNVAHLRMLHQPLRDLAHDLIQALQAGNVPHAHLLRRAKQYSELIDRELTEIPFARLYVEGVLLQNATAAARNKIMEKELPSFDETVDATLGSLLGLHGTFIVSTADGHALIVAEERFERTRDEKQELREATLAFSESLQNHPELVAPRVAALIQETAEQEIGANADRSLVVASSMATNAIIVLVSSATVGALAIAAGALTGVVGAAVTTLIGYEAVKKTRSFQTVISAITQGIDDLPAKAGEQRLTDRTRRLVPFATFVLKLEPLLRRLARGRNQLGWVNASLDWLKEHGKKITDR
jgi:hypothetical protein